MSAAPSPLPEDIKLRLSIRSDIGRAQSELTGLRTLILELLGEDRGEPFALACSEAVNNAILHAHRGNAALTVEVEVKASAARVDVSVCDVGPPFDLGGRIAAQADTPYAELDTDMLPESGLGLFLIKQGSDETHYERIGDRNCLVLIRYRGR
ncbi:ATP-binding protein [Vineibacter terrae]|uniref:ATP-binding protein n=1 Tax=Vineibacter terrae TaxID=2586908 RepID=A0A5C8PEQ2_9HYPH|nr:ATP-binding protein [Vineibacter terrae]TXL71789.1 ATP-binding protein [Vineibacter terrae]